MTTARSEYLLHFISLKLLIIGGLVWGILGITGYNVLSRGAKMLGMPTATKVVYLMIGIASVLMLFRFANREIMSLFGGATVFPLRLVNLSYPLDHNQQVTIAAPAGATRVVYWAALGQEEVNDGLPKKEAYGDFSNSGSVEVEDGQAILRFRKPARYMGPAGFVLDPHVHFRWMDESGNLSKVDIVYV